MARGKAYTRGPYEKRAAKRARGRAAKFGRVYRVGKKFAQKVKRVVRSLAETKEMVGASSLQPQTISNTTASLAGNVIICSPNSSSATVGYLGIPLGTTNGARIGNRVTSKSLVMRYVLSQNPYSAGTYPIPTPHEVILYWFKVKQNPQTPPAVADVAGATANWFEYGASSVGFTGGLLDLTHKISSDRYTYLCHRRHKLGYSHNGSQTNPNYANGQNNDFKMNIVSTVNLTKYCPKEIIYDDTPISTTTSPYIFCLIQCINATGVVNANTVLPVKVDFELFYRYVDM